MEKRWIDPQRLCMGCMAELERPGFPCPHCGFDISKYQKPKNSLPVYEILNGKYLIGRVLGIGGFGITYIGWNLFQGKRVCVKEYFPREIAVRNLKGHTYSEQLSVSLHCGPNSYTQHIDKIQHAYQRGLEAYINEARNLSHYYMMPGIVSIRDFFYGNSTAYIVMEYIDGMDMKKYVKLRGGRLRSEEVFALLKDIFKALAVLHRDNIIHRDISPDNIMLTRQSRAVLIDFGAARDYGNDQDAPVQLKHGYAPVEQYKRDGRQGPWTDVYSLCASIYYMLTGIRIPAATERQKHDTVRRMQILGVPISEAQDLAVGKGLCIKPENRYQSIPELYQALYRETV